MGFINLKTPSSHIWTIIPVRAEVNVLIVLQSLSPARIYAAITCYNNNLTPDKAFLFTLFIKKINGFKY